MDVIQVADVNVPWDNYATPLALTLRTTVAKWNQRYSKVMASTWSGNTKLSDLDLHGGEVIARTEANWINMPDVAFLVRWGDVIGSFSLSAGSLSGTFYYPSLDLTDFCSEMWPKMTAQLPTKEIDELDVQYGFYAWAGQTPSRSNKYIRTRPWAEIVGNYSAPAQNSLGQLMALKSDQISSARLLVLHGPPGTGKTTAIRSLSYEWRKWARFDYVTDPEVMFTTGYYLNSVMLAGDVSDRWTVLVIEDAEEFVMPAAKQVVGQALARLLNLGDGLIGQGTRLLVLMTTNVPFSKLNPAIVRPGRCLANVEVPLLTEIEATAWYGSKQKEAPLAELLEKKRPTQIANAIVTSTPGQYL